MSENMLGEEPIMENGIGEEPAGILVPDSKPNREEPLKLQPAGEEPSLEVKPMISTHDTADEEPSMFEEPL